MTVQTTPAAATPTESTIVDDAGPALVAPPPVRGGDILACGFGMTVAAWIVAYISRIPMFSSPAPGQLTIGLMLSAVFIGGILTARYSAKGLWAAIGSGAVSGLLDILVVGSILHDSAKGASVAPMAGFWIGGSILLNAAVGGAGGLIGMMMPSARRGEVRWGAVFGIILAAATLPLITAGGLVTAFGVGMAVPDWPQSYGYNMFLFPLSKMQSAQGNFYEHAHRLMGSLAGLTSLALSIYLSIIERRKWVIVLAWCIFLAVCVQGILGGLRVTENSIPLATVHGIFAQIVFALMTCLAAAGSSAFIASPRSEKGGGMDRFLSVAFLASLIIQLTLGALARQRFDAMVLIHIMMAAAVTLLALVCGFRALALHAEIRPLKRAGIAILCIVGVQLILGIMALAMRPNADEPRTTTGAVWTTAHQANGALLLATAALLCFWNFRVLRPFSRAE